MTGGPFAARPPLRSPRAPTITAAIQRHVAARDGLTVGDLTSARKERRATRARHIAMWLACVLTRHGATTIGAAFGGRDRSTMAAAWRGLERRLAAEVGLKEEADAPRVSILAAAQPPAHAADPTLRQLARATLDRARIAEHAVARWRDSVAALFAALEARGHVEKDVPEAGVPPAPAAGRIEG